MLQSIIGIGIITGDTNVNLCSNTFPSNFTNFIDNFACSGYVSLGKFSTRRTSHLQTSLDQV